MRQVSVLTRSDQRPVRHSYTGRCLSNTYSPLRKDDVRRSKVPTGGDDASLLPLCPLLFLSLDLVIAELADDLAGLLAIEARDPMARAVIKIRGPTLRRPPVHVCGVTPEVSRRAARFSSGRVRQHPILRLRRAPVHSLARETAGEIRGISRDEMR